MLAELPDDVVDTLLSDWRVWARDNQLAPDWWWVVWLVLAGRGFGKTRTGAELVRERVESGQWRRVALVAATAADARDVMVEGESGILSISHPDFMPVYQPSKRLLTWPNGAMARLYSAEKPNRLRGPQHDGAWADELAAWARMRETWDNLMFGLRLGAHPQVVVTTTGKPRRLLHEILVDPANAVTRGSMYENMANLAPSFVRTVRRKYEGTRLGRQEIAGELLLDVPGALWNRDLIESTRVRQMPELERIVVALDPSVSKSATSNECGLIGAGVARGPDRQRHLYVFRDLSAIMSANEWARKAVDAYRDLRANRIVAEVNNGGDLVAAQLRMVDPNVSYRDVHATRGKRKRAEPVAQLWEQGRGHIVGALPELEDQMCAFLPDGEDESDDDDDESIGARARTDARAESDGAVVSDETGAPVAPTFTGGSPDRVDAMVWAAFDLVVDRPKDRVLDPRHFKKVFNG